MSAPRIVLRHYRLDLTDAEEHALDEAAVAAGVDYRAWVAAFDSRLGLYDAEDAAVLESLAPRVLGRAPVRVVRIEHLVPFEWSAFEGLRTLDSICRALPGALPSPREWRFFGDDLARPPYLWASHEAPGLQLAGWLDEPDWERWWRAFDDATAHLPRRAV